MKQMNAGYEVVSNPVKRAGYDSKRGVAPSSETANNGSSSARSLSQAWRRFVIPISLVVLGALALRLGPRVVSLIIVFPVFVWLLFALVR